MKGFQVKWRRYKKSCIAIIMLLATSYAIIDVYYDDSQSGTEVRNGHEVNVDDHAPKAYGERARISGEARPAIQLAVVACHVKEAPHVIEETIAMMKSALIFSQQLIHFHLFTNDGEELFKQRLSHWPQSVKSKFQLNIYPAVYPLSDSEAEEMRNWWGPCASFRLFLPSVMASTDSVLYVDTDVLFLGPVDNVWQEFDSFGPQHVAGLAKRVGWDFKVPDHNSNFIKVFLMNLTRMRSPVFKTDPEISRQNFSWSKEFLFSLYRQHFVDMRGDQNLINTIFHYNPKLLYYIPCSYNYHHKFCIDAHRERKCDAAERNGAAVVHGNANTYYNNFAPAFRAIHDSMREYNFEEDLRNKLYLPMRQRLQHPDVEQANHCANQTQLLLRNLEKFL